MSKKYVKDNATYHRLLDAAETLFMERGLAAVTLQDIASAIEMRHASLYYYAPKGKEQLYVAVMERTFKRHREGLTDAVIQAGDDFRAQLHAIARWFATHAPLDLGRMARSDLPAIDPSDADRLIDLSLDAIRVPIAAAIRNAMRKGVISVSNVEFAAMGLVGLLQSVHSIPRRFLPTTDDVVQAAIDSADMLLDGWLKH